MDEPVGGGDKSGRLTLCTTEMETVYDLGAKVSLLTLIDIDIDIDIDSSVDVIVTMLLFTLMHVCMSTDDRGACEGEGVSGRRHHHRQGIGPRNQGKSCMHIYVHGHVLIVFYAIALLVSCCKYIYVYSYIYTYLHKFNDLIIHFRV